MTNTVQDYRNFDLNIIIGQNPAEAHPIAMQHILEGRNAAGPSSIWTRGSRKRRPTPTSSCGSARAPTWP